VSKNLELSWNNPALIRDWRKYNKELIRRVGILIDLETIAVIPRMLLLFLKFALRLSYRQTEGVALFG